MRIMWLCACFFCIGAAVAFFAAGVEMKDYITVVEKRMAKCLK